MKAAAIGFGELFDTEFLSSLSHLSLTARRVSRGGRHGELLSQDMGSGAEFRDYRPYSPGDDLRGIDWNIYRRLGKLSLRLFDEQRDLPLYLMPDVSGSMFLESPPRIVAGLRATLALAAIGLSHHDSAGLLPFAEELQVVFKATTGRNHIMGFARHLAELAQASHSHRTHLAAALHRMASMKLRPGLLVIISDFFDAEGHEALRNALSGVRHRLLLIQLVRRTDAHPPFQGDVQLRDCETGEQVSLTVTPEVTKRYQNAYEEFNAGLQILATQRNGTLLRLDVEADLVEQISTLFERGSFQI